MPTQPLTYEHPDLWIAFQAFLRTRAPQAHIIMNRQSDPAVRELLRDAWRFYRVILQTENLRNTFFQMFRALDMIRDTAVQSDISTFERLVNTYHIDIGDLALPAEPTPTHAPQPPTPDDNLPAPAPIYRRRRRPDLPTRITTPPLHDSPSPSNNRSASPTPVANRRLQYPPQDGSLPTSPRHQPTYEPPHQCCRTGRQEHLNIRTEPLWHSADILTPTNVWTPADGSPAPIDDRSGQENQGVQAREA